MAVVAALTAQASALQRLIADGARRRIRSPEPYFSLANVLHCLFQQPEVSFRSRCMYIEDSIDAYREGLRLLTVCENVHETVRPALTRHVAEIYRVRFNFLKSQNPSRASQRALIEWYEFILSANETEFSRDYITELANALIKCYEETSIVHYLDNSISILKAQLRPHQDRETEAEFNGLLSDAFRLKADALGSGRDVDFALQHAERATQLAPECVRLLITLAIALLSKFEFMGAVNSTHDLNDPGLEILETAIDKLTKALATNGASDQDRLVAQTNLQIAQKLKYEETSQRPADFHRALGLDMDPPARGILQAGIPQQVEILTAWEMASLPFLREFEESINNLKAGLRNTPKNHYARAYAITQLSLVSVSKFEFEGDANTLNISIENLQAEVQRLLGLDCISPSRSLTVNAFCWALSRRSSYLGSSEDLHTAIEIATKALACTPSESLFRNILLHLLGTLCLQAFTKTGNDKLLEHSVSYIQRSLEATRKDCIFFIRYRMSLCICLRHLFIKQGRDADDSMQVIREASELLTLLEEDPVEYVAVSHNLSLVYQARFDFNPGIDDADLAVQYSKNVVEKALRTQPEHVQHLFAYGQALEKRYSFKSKSFDPLHQRDALDDLTLCISKYYDAFKLENASPLLRITAARQASLLIQRNLMEESNYVQCASDMLQDAIVELLPSAAPRYLSWHDRQDTIQYWPGISADAASLAICTGKNAHQALQLFELGRGIVFGHMLDCRTEETDLQAERPELYQEFQSLRGCFDPSGLESISCTMNGDIIPLTLNDQQKKHIKLLKVIDKIRSIKKYENFLRLPPEEQLKNYATGGPIVLLIPTKCRSYAILVTATDIETIPLQSLDYPTLMEKVEMYRNALKKPEKPRSIQCFLDCLSWLWEAAAHPILDRLGFNKTPEIGKQWPRVWWIPAGLMSALPIHCAGDYRSWQGNGGKGGSSSVLDLVISSYSPSLRALSYSRQRAQIFKSRNIEKLKALLIAVGNAPGYTELPHAHNEVEGVAEILQKQFEPNLPLKDPSKQRILKELRTDNHQVIHFACHGISDTLDPSLSSLILADDKLKVGEVIRLRLRQAHLMYLSACETREQNLIGLMDENIHIVGAFQLAGCPNVIGTMWKVSDKISSTVASLVYNDLLESGKFDSSRAAVSLHKAIRQVRDDQGSLLNPFFWSSYVHVGC